MACVHFDVGFMRNSIDLKQQLHIRGLMCSIFDEKENIPDWRKTVEKLYRDSAQIK